MEPASVERVEGEQEKAWDDNEWNIWGASRKRAFAGGDFKKNKAMGREEDEATKRKLEDKEAFQRFSQQYATDFDPTFEPKHTPRIALLCRVCHTALRTATYLSKDESHRQKLASGALRVRIWGMDLFDPTQCTPLDELLGLPSVGRISLRNHLTGIWADIAVTLELILQYLIAQTGEASPESCAQWRRLRIVLGLEDVAAAVHDGFSPSGSIESDCNTQDNSETLTDSINSIESLIDSLFDLLVTIGTIRQLHKLGFVPNATSSSNVSTVENRVDEGNDNEDAHYSRVLPPPSATTSRATSVQPSKGSQRPRNRSSRVSGDYPAVNSSLNLPRATTWEDLGKERLDDWTAWSNVAVVDSPPNQPIGSFGQKKNPPGLVDTLDNAKPSSNGAKNTSQSVRRDLPNHRSQFQKPVKLQDVYGRIFAFPFELCRTWNGMQDFIKEAFESTTGPYAKAYRAHVTHGKYDIIDRSDNEVIIPSQWESLIAPGMNLRMVIHSIDYLDMQSPHTLSYHDPQNSYRQSRKRSKTSRDAGAPSRVYQGYINSNRESQGEVTQKQKNSNDEETTPIASAVVYRSENGPSPTGRSPRHGRYLSLPETSSLPNFEELGTGIKLSQKPVAHPVRNDYEYADFSTSFADHTYSGMGNAGAYYPSSTSTYVDQPGVSYYPSSTSSYANQPGVSYPIHKGPVPHVPGPLPWPVLNPIPSGKPAQQPLDPVVDKRLARLEQLLLDEKAERKAREAAEEKAEQDLQAIARNEAKVAERAKWDLETATIKADKDETETKQAATEGAKAPVEMEESVGKDTTAAEPKPVELNDAFGRTFVFPYQMCSTWERMDSLVKQAFPHDKLPYPQIAKGHYDFLSPSGDVLLPGIWQSSVEPGGKVTMRLWPFDGFGIQETSISEMPNLAALLKVGHKASPRFSKSDSKTLDDVGSSAPTTPGAISPSSPPPPPNPSPEAALKRKPWILRNLSHSTKTEHNTSTSSSSSEDEAPGNRKPRSKWRDLLRLNRV